uniref:Uncharacterized protein n=1 Tax=Chromera velia CCMP2878 TaxID=1169474 RepID=A0A0G4I8M7_9ALVE|eukprot:Cvel_11995.t1-p1 / transcript=Cvel_11995.t1 / gene=Cvel_11995 / organism=Chromera_velia_CCMP2878 / gene_product=hypothetical protein / transcript_product=hypothetical protein / location=Cvel_scaffold770:2690-3515(+) / protein_length=93 / sequence_SO=supercontig / SO=protein_coding / is_pseudo=false
MQLGFFVCWCCSSYLHSHSHLFTDNARRCTARSPSARGQCRRHHSFTVLESPPFCRPWTNWLCCSHSAEGESRKRTAGREGSADWRGSVPESN